MRGLKSKTTRVMADTLNVAPLVGAWIEMMTEVGLFAQDPRVAPLVGAWIEIKTSSKVYSSPSTRRTPRGCVD